MLKAQAVHDAAGGANTPLDDAKKASLLNEAIAQFSHALINPNVYIRSYAAGELLNIFCSGIDVPAQTIALAKHNAPPAWAAALDAAAEPPFMREKALAFLLGAEFSLNANIKNFYNEAARYLFDECIKLNSSLFSPGEKAAIDARNLVFRSRFAEALVHFRLTLEEPSLFFDYPALLNDLGRCFQYTTNTGSEGIDLFLSWENKLSQAHGVFTPQALAGGLTQNIFNNARFRLLFYAGRIARHRSLPDQEFFERALPFAPDPLQSDACIWYIMDSALKRSHKELIPLLPQLMPQFHDNEYFYDIMDKLSAILVRNRAWQELSAIFPLAVKYADSGTCAKYAYIAASALKSGLFTEQEASLIAFAMESSGSLAFENADALARSCMALAYKTSIHAGDKAFYYSSVSAANLNIEFFKLLPQKSFLFKPREQNQSDKTIFLTCFFKYNAADFVLPYIRSMEKELKGNEKLIVAKTLNDANFYLESMRLLTMDAELKGLSLGRQGLEILYPRPYKNIVEKYAREYGIAPDLLYALIRTESAFQSGVVSKSGAIGLTQLMPATAEETAARIKRQGGPDYTKLDTDESLNQAKFLSAILDPDVNIRIGSAYLKYLLDRMESPLLAILAYNGGINRIRRWHNAFNQNSPVLGEDLFLETIEFTETREYGRKVLAAQAVYKMLYYSDIQ